MTEKDKTEESIRFVVRHFSEDTLLPGTGWQRFRSSHHISSFRRNLAAACVCVVVLVASASIYYLTTKPETTTPVESVDVKPVETAVAPEQRVERIEFHNAQLKEVVAEIEKIYSVIIGNVPDDNILITISYEGTAQDVADTLNDLFDLHLTVTYPSAAL